jgi:hypothetical protein
MEFYQCSFLCFCVYLVFCYEVLSIVYCLGVLFFTDFVLTYSSVGTFVVFIYLLSLLLFWFTVLSLPFYIRLSLHLFWGTVLSVLYFGTLLPPVFQARSCSLLFVLPILKNNLK